MKNETKIVAPEGCEYAGIEEATDGVVVKWKEKNPFGHLPKKLGDFKKQKWMWIDEDGDPTETNALLPTTTDCPPHFAPALIAFIDLLKYLHAWREGWEPDWADNETEKWCVCFQDDALGVFTQYSFQRVFSFQDEARAIAFLETFRDKIEAARPLL